MSCIYIGKDEFQNFYENVLKFRLSSHYDGGHMYKYGADEIYSNIVRIQKIHVNGFNDMYGEQMALNTIEKEPNPLKYDYVSLSEENLKKLLLQVHYIEYQSDDLECNDEFMNALSYDLAYAIIRNDEAIEGYWQITPLNN